MNPGKARAESQRLPTTRERGARFFQTTLHERVAVIATLHERILGLAAVAAEAGEAVAAERPPHNIMNPPSDHLRGDHSSVEDVAPPFSPQEVVHQNGPPHDERVTTAVVGPPHDVERVTTAVVRPPHDERVTTAVGPTMGPTTLANSFPSDDVRGTPSSPHIVGREGIRSDDVRGGHRGTEEVDGMLRAQQHTATSEGGAGSSSPRGGGEEVVPHLLRTSGNYSQV